MNWHTLHTPEDLHHTLQIAKGSPLVLFKHSPRCSISNMAKARLEREYEETEMPFYVIDVLQSRPLSNLVSEMYDVHHESPQVLLIQNNKCVYDESHNAISFGDIIEQTRLV